MLILHQRIAGKEFRVLLRTWRDDYWTADCLGLSDCVSEGASDSEALENLHSRIIYRLGHDGSIDLTVEHESPRIGPGL